MEQDDNHIEVKPAQGAGEEALREPWERRRDESVKAFEAFTLYLNSEKRSLSDIARDSKFQCSVTNIWRWSVVHKWKDRCWAFDERREDEQQAQLARDRVSMRDRHLKIAMSLQSIAVHGIKELQAKVATGVPLGLSADEIKGLMAEATKLERTTLGTEGSRKYSKIIVNFGGGHRYAGEPCGCHCEACSTCTGPTNEDGTTTALETEGYDEDGSGERKALPEEIN